MIAESARYKALLDRDAAICQEMETLLESADPDTGEMSDEATTQFEALEKEGGTLTATLGREQILRDRKRNLTPQPDGNRQAEQAANDATRRADTGDVRHVKDRVDDDPTHGFGTGIRGHRNFFHSVIAAGLSGPEAAFSQWPGLRKFQATVGSDEHSTFDESRGGFLIPTTILPGVEMLDLENDPVSPLVGQMPMMTPTVKMNALVDKNHSSSVSGGFTVSRRDESGAASASRQQYEQITWTAHSLFGLAYATEEILADSPVSFAALIQEGFAREFPSRIMTERLNGTGAGEFLGVNNLGSSLLITVTKETKQPADTIVAENIIKMRARCWGYGNAIWLANHDTLSQMFTLSQTAGTTAISMYQPSLREDHADVLLGRPIFYNENPETLGDAGDILLVNWSQYKEGTFQPMAQAESMHVRFVNHERAFKFWTRNDARPAWKVALTGKKGSVTRSPFVRLAARA